MVQGWVHAEHLRPAKSDINVWNDRPLALSDPEER
jgi:hypothetical protein